MYEYIILWNEKHRYVETTRNLTTFRHTTEAIQYISCKVWKTWLVANRPGQHVSLNIPLNTKPLMCIENMNWNSKHRMKVNGPFCEFVTVLAIEIHSKISFVLSR
jgi:hypothetical protein